ncbi:MAG: class I SAM-dependent methyltransferase [Isosphaerales bacterium]
MSFKDKDHFSGHADRYEAFRPTYPEALFAYLTSLCPFRDLAWDCATGNGQAAVAVAAYFRAVIATDASQKQIDQAHPRENVRYLVAPADAVSIDDASVDLITVAQALHWLDLPAFYAEVRRVARRACMIAVWCYQLHTIAPKIDAIIHRLYADIVGADWPPERRLVEDGYRTLAFPFEEVDSSPFQMVHSWDLNHLVGYLGSWSSVQRYRTRTGLDPLELIRAELELAWGEPGQSRDVKWPLHVRVGRVSPR